MYIINDWLATHGLDWQFDDSGSDDDILEPDIYGMINGYKVLDLRDKMRDAPTNEYVYAWLIGECIKLIHQHGRVVICCSAGISRSNAIAIGTLMSYKGMSFDEAYRLVKQKVPIANPLPCHIDAIKSLK